MNPTLQKLRIFPQEVATNVNSGWTSCVKMLKETKKRNGCIRTSMNGRNGVFQRSCKVPWTSEWIKNNKERRRKALVESVDNVNGRNSRIWRTVDNLHAINCPNKVRGKTYLAVCERTLQNIRKRDIANVVYQRKRMQVLEGCCSTGRILQHSNDNKHL